MIISNPLWLISSIKAGIKWILINSWNGFFSIGSSILGLGIVLSGGSLSFILSTLYKRLFFELLLFSFILISFSWLFIASDLDTFISEDLDLLVLSDNSLFISLFGSKFSSVKKYFINTYYKLKKPFFYNYLDFYQSLSSLSQSSLLSRLSE